MTMAENHSLNMARVNRFGLMAQNIMEIGGSVTLKVTVCSIIKTVIFIEASLSKIEQQVLVFTYIPTAKDTRVSGKTICKTGPERKS